MRLAILVLVSICCLGQSQQPQASVPLPVSLKLSSSKTTFKPNSEIRLTITVTNASDHRIFVPKEKRKDQGELNYSFNVQDVTGKSVPETKYGRALKGKQTDGQMMVVLSAPGLFPLDPGQSMDEDVILGKMFDLSAPGKYTVTADRVDEATGTDVKSNALTITIQQ